MNTEQAPKYYKFHRRTIGNLNTATKVLNKLSTLGITGGIVSPLATYMAESRINLILPIMAGIVAYVAQIANDCILYVISVAEIDDGH